MHQPGQGWWWQFVKRRGWNVMRPPGPVGRVIRFHAYVTGFGMTLLDRWYWPFYWPKYAWYYKILPARLRPVDLSIDFGEGE
jgi:hypothetical protein